MLGFDIVLPGPDWPFWQAANAVMTLLLLVGSLFVNVALWRSQKALAELAKAEVQRNVSSMEIADIRLDLRFAYVTIANKGWKDGAISEIFVSREGDVGDVETYVLSILDPIVIEGNRVGSGTDPVDFMIRSGDRREFLVVPGKVRRYVDDKPVESEIRPAHEVWFGTDRYPAALTVNPVLGEGDVKPMPVHFMDGSPARPFPEEVA